MNTEKKRERKIKYKKNKAKKFEENKYLERSRKIRRKILTEKRNKIESLSMKIKEVENLNRRLKRKIQNLETNKLETTVSSDVQPGPSSNSSEGVDTMLMGSVSPASKKRAIRRLKLCTQTPSPMKRYYRLDRKHTYKVLNSIDPLSPLTKCYIS